MTGIEVIGIAAAVLQLSQQTFSIISTLVEIYGTVRDAPAKLRDGAEQLERLVEITKISNESKLFETESIQAQLYAVVDRTKAIRNLITELKASSKVTAKRYLRAVTGNIKEKALVAQFRQLEKEKTALILAITSVHANLFDGTSNKIDDIHQNVQHLNLLMSQLHIKRPNPNISRVFGMHNSCNDYGEDADSISYVEVMQTSCSSTGSLSDGSTTPASSVSDFANLRDDHSYSLYKNMEAKDKAIQLNGDLGSSGTLLKTYYGNIASDHSIQVNGDISNLDFMGTLLARR